MHHIRKDNCIHECMSEAHVINVSFPQRLRIRYGSVCLHVPEQLGSSLRIWLFSHSSSSVCTIMLVPLEGPQASASLCMTCLFCMGVGECCGLATSSLGKPSHSGATVWELLDEQQARIHLLHGQALLWVGHQQL